MQQRGHIAADTAIFQIDAGQQFAPFALFRQAVAEHYYIRRVFGEVCKIISAADVGRFYACIRHFEKKIPDTAESDNHDGEGGGEYDV